MCSAQNVCVCCMYESKDCKNLNDIEFTYTPLRVYEILYKIIPAMGQMNKQNPDQFPLSEIICLTCYGNLLRAYEFQKQCLASLQSSDLLLETPMASVDMLQTNETIKLEIENGYVEQIICYNEVKENEQLEKEDTKDLLVEDVDFSNPLGCSGNDEEIFNAKKKRPKRIKSRPKSRKRYYPCQDCGRVFSQSFDLKRHRSVHSLDKPLECNTCSYRFNTSKALKAHMSQHEMEANGIHRQPRRKQKDIHSDGQKRLEKNISCDICGKKFIHQYTLNRHRLVHSTERPHECNLCKYRFSAPKFLQAHMNRHENVLKKSEPKEIEFYSDGYYKCPDCPKRFEKKKSFWSHRKQHTSSKPGGPCSCTICGQVFTTKNLLKVHTTIKHPEVELHKCDQCDKTYALHVHLLEHLNRHNSNLICLTCKKEFARPSGIKAHKCKLNSSQTPYLCTECGKSFGSSGNLGEHMKIHTNLRKYQCPECPSRFNSRSSLSKHASTHSNVKPFACDECSSSFTRPWSLKKHKLLHTGERPYKCDQCNMSFAVKYTLHRHTRTHTGEKPLKCKFCDRAYAEYGDLTKHLRTHVGENTYMCEECPMAFKYQAELKQHQSEHYKAAQKLLEQTQKQSQEIQDETVNKSRQLPSVVEADHHDNLKIF